MAHQCPALAPDYKLIKEGHGTLASTGCTREFCEAGRAIHTDEPRVGENRAVDVVEQEAEDFLIELYKEKFFANEAVFQERLKRVRVEIRSSSVEGVIRETQKTGIVGGVWTQTPQELEFGLRRAWRNARKCIMRSHCEDLRLCDLRSVKSSAQMAVELVKGITDAYNGGKIIPTVFVFPPRTANNRGPMIWNDQILSFASYETEDGSIMGDPKNVQLTKDIIELGWVPPRPRSRWDVLPVAVMAENDKPAVIELPANIRRLVKIRHPKYEAAFWKLDLKWVAFPAWSRLGFDIGGVQYTATPFIGWFMDAQIGVRALADSFRYNVLPDVIKALHLDNGALAHANSFEELPKYEQLAMLSRAQIELNYAIYHSFLRDRITMSDSLAASKNWTRYDDEFEKKNGYRLPSDPYWIAPPQGSIIPLWHRGGAPNFQPKPLICRHVQDPAKAWQREQQTWAPMVVNQPARAQSPTVPPGLTRDDSATDGKPIPISPKNVEIGTISDVETNPNNGGPSLEISLFSSTSQGGIESPLAESDSSTDYFSFSTDVESDSLASSWDALVELAAILESSPPTSLVNLPLSTDLNLLSSHWETLVEPAAKPESSSLISADEPSLPTYVSSPSSSCDTLVEPTAEPELNLLTNVDNVPLSNDEKLRSSISWDTLELAAQPESSPSTSMDKSPISRHRKSNSLSTIEEDSNEDVDEEGEEESESEDQNQEIRHIERDDLIPVTRTGSTDVNDLPIDFSVDGEPNISPPPVTTVSDHTSVEDSNPSEKEEQENEPSPSGAAPTLIYDLAIVTRSVDDRPALLESIAMAEKTLAVPRASMDDPSGQHERPQQYELPLAVGVVWPTIYMPTLHAYAGTIRGPNPFTLEDPIKVISRVFKHMYSHLIQPYKAEIGPERLTHSDAHGKPVPFASRNVEADGLLISDDEARSSSDSRALGSPSYSSTSKNSMEHLQTESSSPTNTSNPSLPTDVESGSWSSGWDALELAAKLHCKVKAWAENLHDIILTAQPFDNLGALIADKTFFWSSAQAVREIFQLMVKALHRRVRNFAAEDKRRKVASAIRSSATVVVDMLLVYLTLLRARWGDP